MRKKAKVVARIENVEYTLLGDVDQEQINTICQMVDDMIAKIKKSNPLMSRNMVLILSCLNLSDEILQLKLKNGELEDKLKGIDDINDLKEQLSTYKEYNKRNSTMNDEIKQENETLKKELEKTKALMEQYTKKNRQYKYDVEESRKIILDLQNQLFESQIELVKGNKQD